MKKNKTVSSDSFKYSLKRRISSIYALVYVIVSLLTLLIFCAALSLNGIHEIVASTPKLRNDILTHAFVFDITSDEFRFYLNSLCKFGEVDEIYIVDESGSVAAGTTLSYEKIEKYNARTDFVTALFPNISKIFDGYYLDNAELFTSGDGTVYSVIICYNVSGVFKSVKYSASLLALIMIPCLFVFIFAGYARTNRMLRPINDITEVAKKISGENLDLRIDEKRTEPELSELVKTINDMFDRIKVSYDKQKRFVSDVSHELRTPIAVISGYGSMLKRWGKTDEAILNESIDAIISESDNMKDLVEKLLFLTRLDNDNISFDMEEKDVSELVTVTVKEEEMVHPNMEFRADIDGGVIAKIDVTRFKQAIRIFLDNAVKYSGDSKNVDVSLKKLPEGFCLSIRDYGIGISEEDLPNIFERFYRADTSRTKETGGYGLGLAIAKIIVTNHNGYIRVRTKDGEGSEFSMIIKTVDNNGESIKA